jgi:hypothetical protein
MGRVERDRELARRRQRRAKLKKLRLKYREAQNDQERARIVEKVRKISPFVKLEEEEKAAAKA